MKRKVITMFLLLVLFISSNPSHLFAAENGIWTSKAPLPTPVYTHSATALNEKIYVVGGASDGTTPQKGIQEYNPTSDSWKMLTDMNYARADAAVIPFNGLLYVFGGHPQNARNPIATIEIYNPVTDSWTIKGSIPSPRSGIKAALVNNKIYLIGGINADLSLSNVVQEYDPVANTWMTKASLPTPRQHAGVAVVDNKIYILGGLSNPNNSLSKTVEVYDPATNSWIKKTDMPFSSWSSGATTLDGKIYVIGGTRANQRSAEINIYDPLSETWELGPTLLEPRSFSESVTLNGNIYTIGGSDTNGISKRNEMLTLALPYEFILSGVNNGESNTLNWNGLEKTSSYELKRSLTSGGPYEIINTSKNNSFKDSNIAPNNTYYYVVSALGLDGVYRDSNEISLLSQGNIENEHSNALLLITMTNGLQKEYDLPMSEINSFLDWYDSASESAKYGINKHDNNKGPFSKRTEYVVHDKILTFEVSEYTVSK